jgi:hypothetical protein
MKNVTLSSKLHNQYSWLSISQYRFTQNFALVEEFPKSRQISFFNFVLKLRLGQILTYRDSSLVEKKIWSRQLKSNIFFSELVEVWKQPTDKRSATLMWDVVTRDSHVS